MSLTDEAGVDVVDVVDVVDGVDEGEVGEGEPVRGRASYPLRRIGKELPEAPPQGRSRLFFDLLAKVKDDADQPNDEWYAVAEYVTATGAADAYGAIEKGDRDIPSGRWAFDAQRADVVDPNSGETRRGSMLYAKYQGEVESQE